MLRDLIERPVLRLTISRIIILDYLKTVRRVAFRNILIYIIVILILKDFNNKFNKIRISRRKISRIVFKKTIDIFLTIIISNRLTICITKIVFCVKS